LIYLDTLPVERVQRPLFHPELNLSGRPDYVIRRRRDMIPVELKAASAPVSPYKSHVLQLAAYCALVEASFGRRPREAVLKYRDRAVAIEYGRPLERLLEDTLHAMRQAEGRQPDRSHESPSRCRGCGYRAVCDQRLA
jgi:CRISPR-associated exonuclease Cas4